MYYLLGWLGIGSFALLVYGVVRVVKPKPPLGRPIAALMIVTGFIFMGICVNLGELTPQGKAKKAAEQTAIAAKEAVHRVVYSVRRRTMTSIC